MIDLDGLNVAAIVLAVLYGAALGGIHFGALWLTVRRLNRHRHPEIVLIGSFMVRFGLVLTAFYLIMDGGHWVRLLAALFGLILARTLFVRTSISHTRPASAPS